MNSNKLKNNSRQYFDEMAGEYDQNKIPEPLRCYQLLLETLKEDFSSLLDVGCGTGSMLQMISDKYNKDIHLVGVDLSEKMIVEAKKKLGDKAEFHVGDVENLKLPSDGFDIVLCMHSFHHYPNPNKAMSEMFKVVREGGKVIVVDNYSSGIKRYIKNVMTFFFNRKNGDIKIYSLSEMKKIMENNGLRVVSTKLLTDKSFICVGEK